MARNALPNCGRSNQTERRLVHRVRRRAARKCVPRPRDLPRCCAADCACAGAVGRGGVGGGAAGGVAAAALALVDAKQRGGGCSGVGAGAAVPRSTADYPIPDSPCAVFAGWRADCGPTCPLVARHPTPPTNAGMGAGWRRFAGVGGLAVDAPSPASRAVVAWRGSGFQRVCQTFGRVGRGFSRRWLLSNRLPDSAAVGASAG